MRKLIIYPLRGFGLALLLLVGLQSCSVAVAQNMGELPPLFAEELERTEAAVNQAMEAGFEVPTPKDMAGGYTHEVHKQNWKTLGGAAALYRHTGEEKYARFVRDGLLDYAEVYRSWPRHPTDRSYATGKIFWQCLNDANWLVFVSQAYADIYDWIDAENKQKLNEELFRPMADFLSLENPQFFNRIHNHSTWGNAAVGMIGLVMEDEELVQRALYGIPATELPEDLRDDDSGRIVSETGRAGFLAQLDLSFSPDGYFTEGPYYLRYALTPFLLFGRMLADERPDLNVLEYRDGILGKAVTALLLQADPTGDFFPLNDSQKGMSLYSSEVVKSVDYGYYYFGKNPELLSLAEKQDKVTLDEAGLAVAKAIAAGDTKPYKPRSLAFTDGAEGTEGGVGVLRAYGQSGDQTSLVQKYSAQGMGHGHFDKLSYSLYNETGEVIQDYGAARWVNIDQKGGGRYLPENNTWSKQSVAHNTLVLDQVSHYEGDIRIAENFHPDLYAFLGDDPQLQMVSAKTDNAYPGRELHRSQILLTDPEFAEPLLLDIFRCTPNSDRGPATVYDLPTWYKGQLLQTDLEYETNNELSPLGDSNGYQHLWTEATAEISGQTFNFNWFHEGTFYTQTNVATPGDELLMVRLGANDPSFNLRRDPAIIHRRKGTGPMTFVSVLETHGSYTPREEVALSPFGSITDLQLLVDTEEYTAVSFSNENGHRWLVLLSNQDASPAGTHTLTVDGKNHQWTGVLHLTKLK